MVVACGWFGSVLPGGIEAEAVLAAMTDSAVGRGKPLSVSGREAALAVSSASRDADLATVDDVIVGVLGTPCWSSANLQEMASRLGHATAAVEAYGRYERDLLSQLHGPFGLIILDADRGRALIAIDRAGIYPMYCSEDLHGGVVFATTATALARHPAMSRTISPQGLFDYLFFYRVPAPGSIFRGQRKLLPGQSVVIEGDRQQTRRYWQMPFTADGDRDPMRLKTALFSHLRTAVGRTVVGEDLSRTGVFLSGGLDSSTVLGLFTEMSLAPVKAFTVGFEAEAYDETDYAKTAAQAFGAEHHVYYVTDEDVASEVQRIAAAYDEPFGNSSAVPVYLCARCAREHDVDLLLAGDGGDELFAGNKIYLRMKIFELYDRIPRVLRRYLLEPLINAVEEPSEVVLLGKSQRYVSQAKVPMPDRMVREELARLVRADEILVDDLAGEVDPLHPLKILREVYHRPAAASLEQRMHLLEQQVVLADNDLRKVNRMCELAGVRVRFPILDEEVMTFSAGIPSELFLRGLELRSFYKRALRGYLPEKIIRKRKHGFGLPSGPLLGRESRLRELAYDSLSSLKGRGYLRPDYIDGVLSRHRDTEQAVDAGAIWDMMMLELWCQAHVERQQSGQRP